jgi:nitrite reductase (NADH) large subunit
MTQVGRDEMHTVIVGNGVAGVTAARIIREKESRAKISIYSDENHLYYPRPRLYEVLSGESGPKETYMFNGQWYKRREIALHVNNKVSSIEIDEKTLLLENRSKVDYDKLLLANGAHPFLPPIPGVERTGVFSLRSIKDALEIREYTKKSEKAVIVGGGLLGWPASRSCRDLP